MIKEVEIDNMIFIEQTTYFIYKNEEDKKEDRKLFTTSDKNRFEEIKSHFEKSMIEQDIKFQTKMVGLRKRINLTQQQVAEKLSVTRQSIQAWEKFKKPLPTKRRVELEKIYSYGTTERKRD